MYTFYFLRESVIGLLNLKVKICTKEKKNYDFSEDLICLQKFTREICLSMLLLMDTGLVSDFSAVLGKTTLNILVHVSCSTYARNSPGKSLLNMCCSEIQVYQHTLITSARENLSTVSGAVFPKRGLLFLIC